jgi:hypothetical protein
MKLPRDQWDDLDYQEVKRKVVACIPRHGGLCLAREIYRALGLQCDAQSEEGSG